MRDSPLSLFPSHNDVPDGGGGGSISLGPRLRTTWSQDPCWPTMDMYCEQEINLCCFKPLRFGSFVITAYLSLSWIIYSELFISSSHSSFSGFFRSEWTLADIMTLPLQSHTPGITTGANQFQLSVSCPSQPWLQQADFLIILLDSQGSEFWNKTFFRNSHSLSYEN